MALLITNPRHIRRNGVLNKLIAKHLAEGRRGADAAMGRRSEEHRDLVAAFKRDKKQLDAFKAEHKAEIAAARAEKAARREAARADKSKHFLVAKAGYSVDADGHFKRPASAKSNPRNKKTANSQQLSLFAGSESGAVPARKNKRNPMKKIRRNMKRRRNPIALRLNPIALRMNRKHRRKHAKKARHAMRRNAIAIRTNGIVIRANGRKRHAKRHHAKRHHARRHNPAFIVPNGKKRKHHRKHHRKGGMFAKMRRNFGHAMGVFAPQPLSLPIKRFFKAELALPVIGAGLAVGAAHYYAAPQVARGIEWIGSQAAKLPVVGEYAQKGFDFAAEHAAYTTTGLAAGAALAIVGSLAKRPQLGMALGAAAVTSGLAMDALGFLTKRSQMGSLYESFPPASYGAVAASGSSYGAVVESQYADAQMADASACGKDFSHEEGQALVSGPAAVLAVAGAPSIAQGVRRTDVALSRFAGLRMHRWGWLIKAVGFDRARKIAMLSPSERLKVIDQLRKQAIAAADASLASSAAALPDYGAVAESFSAHSAMGATAPGAYGAELVLGAGY